MELCKLLYTYSCGPLTGSALAVAGLAESYGMLDWLCDGGWVMIVLVALCLH
jgi:hypothetical protein